LRQEVDHGHVVLVYNVPTTCDEVLLIRADAGRIIVGEDDKRLPSPPFARAACGNHGLLSRGAVIDKIRRGQ
jgi:hypothetical protein